MNKLYKFAALLSVSLLALAGCTQEELSTDQFSDENVTFAAMAPNPVARGGALRIQGSNLDKIVEVRIPGVDPITEIIQVDTLKGRLSEIRVVVPVDGPEVGKVVIVDGEGNEYTSLADLTYSEPIIFTGFTPENAMPGDVVTIKGDYMNNIRSVQFGAAAPVVVFAEQSRYELKVVVPSDAVTGKVIISDVDENNNPDGLVANLFYSEKDITIGSPTVKAVDRGMLKAGDKIKVTGAYLDMIEKAAFKVTTPAAEEGAEPTVAYTEVDFTLAEDHKSITVELPASVVDGEVVLTSYAGEEFAAGAYSTVVPTQVAIAAESRFKAGLNAVVTGKDLDLVSSAALAGTALDFVFADNKLTFAIPAKAVDGAVVLTLANGKTVETEAIELVKPVITALSKASLMAGETFAVEGTDLDLVTEVLLKDKACEFEYDSETKTITVKTTNTSVTGKVTIKTVNGTTVVSESEVVVEYDSLIIVTTLPSSASIGDAVTMVGANFNMIEAIYFGDIKVTGYSKRADDEMVFVIPETVDTGNYQIKFVLTNGDEETCPAAIEVKGAITTLVLWEGSHPVGAWNNNLELRPDEYPFGKIPYGSVLNIEFEVNSEPAQDYYMLQYVYRAEGWPKIGETSFAPGATFLQVQLTNADIDNIYTYGLALLGHYATVKRVYITYQNGNTDPSFPTDIMINDFNQHGDHNATWDNSWAGYATGIMSDDTNGYLEITGEGAGWLINCNHQSSGALGPIITGTHNYVVKLDVYVPSGWSAAEGEIGAQLVLGNWYWIGGLPIGDVVGKDRWMTWTFPLPSAVPDELDLSSGDVGLAIEGPSDGNPHFKHLPVGMKIDNFRLSLK